MEEKTNLSWECHKCHKVWSPDIKYCPNCSQPETEDKAIPDTRKLLVE